MNKKESLKMGQRDGVCDSKKKNFKEIYTSFLLSYKKNLILDKLLDISVYCTLSDTFRLQIKIQFLFNNLALHDTRRSIISKAR